MDNHESREKRGFYAQQISKAKVVTVRMMQDRGFLPLKRLPDPKEATAKEPIIWEFSHQDTGEKACVFWDLCPDSKMPFMQQIFAMAATEKLDQAILILPKPLVSKAKASATNMSKNFNLTMFVLAELQFPIVDHVDVPEHTRMSEKEAKEALHKFQMTLDTCLWIYTTDPITKWYGWREGDIIKIRRSDEGALQDTFVYRAVREPNIEAD